MPPLRVPTGGRRIPDIVLVCLAMLLSPARARALDGAAHMVLSPSGVAPWVERFNAQNPPTARAGHIPDSRSLDWLAENIPLFDCPDPEINEIYYFRWWTFRQHLRKTEQGFLFTEFLTPVKHAGVHNTISCAVGHHLDEGRWLHDPVYLDDYTRFWLRSDQGKPVSHFHAYSSWFAAAVWDRFCVSGDPGLMVELLPDLVADYQRWESERLLPDGLFWQYDVRDGMEESISGSRTLRQARPTINAYMFANARAIARMARLAGNSEIADAFESRARRLHHLVQTRLWDADAGFFKVRRDDGTLADVREAIGFVPWTFGLPDLGRGFEVAWAQLTDPSGFRAPFGITTAERRHPAFRSHGCCGCEWDGAVWPFATSQVLKALANVLGASAAEVADTPSIPITPRDYLEAFLTYVRSHRLDGKPYIGEYLDETTGQWLKGRQERSRHYNHSTFADLLITGLIGLRPRPDDLLEVHPLVPPDSWDWFALDNVRYHGRTLTLLWDRDGSRYHRGRGFQVFADGHLMVRSETLSNLRTSLP